MPTLNYTSPDGSQHQLPLAEGQDANQVVADFETRQGLVAPSTDGDLADVVSGELPSLDQPADIPTSVDEAVGKRSTAAQIVRGGGLGARAIVGAIPKAATKPCRVSKSAHDSCVA